MITVVCYNSVEYWKSKKRALAFYLQGMRCCEGCEKNRYSNIVLDIQDGCNICCDEYMNEEDKKKYVEELVKQGFVETFPDGSHYRDKTGKVLYPICPIDC